jgi:hypothetical protein
MAWDTPRVGRVGEAPDAGRTPAARVSAGGAVVQRLQRAAGNRAVTRLLAGSRPLADGPRADMEAAFGVDFSDVRIREDGEPSRLGAVAFAEGSDVHFAPGRFDPAGSQGRVVLAHELAHVLQQRAGRVSGAQAAGGGLHQDPALEAEATRLGERAARGDEARVEGAPRHAGADRPPPVRQGYLVFNPAAGHANVANYNPHTTFNAQQKVGGSFMNALAAPNIVAGAANVPVRISQNGLLAVEDSDLTNRQPKYFFATAGSVQGFNERLMRVGSVYQLVANHAETLDFDLNGVHRQLVRVDARNVSNNTSGDNLTTAQFCEQMIKEVTGASTTMAPALGRNPATPMPNQPGYETVYADIAQYYVADELAGTHHAANIDLQNAPLAYPTHSETIGVAYGTAMHAHLNVAANPALDLAAQQMQVNQYASPDVGEGIVTQRLGETVAGAVQDPYHARVENAPSDATLWRYHWGGAVARDGTDFVTLENYARSAEDALGNVGGDPRFYFQMYGAGGGQSWHEQWATIHAGTRNFANPLTMKVLPTPPPGVVAGGHYQSRAHQYFNAGAVADDYQLVGGVTTSDKLGVFLYKALAFAEDPTVGDRNAAGNSRTYLWLVAIAGLSAAPLYAPVAPFANHVRARLVQAADAKNDLDADNQYGATVNAVKDDYALLAGAANAAAIGDQLRKALAYANRRQAHDRSGRRSRVNAWLAAIANAGQPNETAGLRAHTIERLRAIRG